MLSKSRECNGSVVECLSPDQEAAVSSLASITALRSIYSESSLFVNLPVLTKGLPNRQSYGTHIINFFKSSGVK